MEYQYLNSIEIKGVVGNINRTAISTSTVARFSVATLYSYQDKDGGMVCETTWHSCLAWIDKFPIVENINKGDFVHIKGRLRSTTYCGVDGLDHKVYEIIVGEINKISE